MKNNYIEVSQRK